MKSRPLISVIMPVFNAEKYLAEALGSVFAQTYQPIEIICVNDGSRDRSLEILKSFGERITLIDCPENRGIGAARNAGIEAAKGGFLVFMDADDIWEPEKTAAQIAQFEAIPDLDISFSHMKCFLSPELPEEVRSLRYCPPDEAPGYISGTAMVKASSFRKAGPFDPRWKVGEFIDWMAKARAAGLKSGIVPGVFLRRRIHATNTGVTERPSRNDYLRIMRESLARKKSS